MEPVDASTAAFYEDFADESVERWEQIPADAGVARWFDHVFDQPSTLLDIGFGSGRDLADLMGRGHDVYGVEPSHALRNRATQCHPELDGRVTAGSLPDAIDLPSIWPHRFDGVVCSAVLMHLPIAIVSRVLDGIQRLLLPHGRILISVPSTRPSVVDGRDPSGRLFSGITSAQLIEIGEPIGFRLGACWSDQADAQSRPGNTWDVLYVELVS